MSDQPTPLVAAILAAVYDEVADECGGYGRGNEDDVRKIEAKARGIFDKSGAKEIALAKLKAGHWRVLERHFRGRAAKAREAFSLAVFVPAPEREGKER